MNPLILRLFLGIVATLTACVATIADPGPPTPDQGRPSAANRQLVVVVHDTAFPVELALTPAQRAQGLSGRPNLAPGTGMLFILEEEAVHPFWMKNMRFPLDMVWVSAHCMVVDITLNAPPPAPGQTEADLPLFTPKFPARYVLELNAGEAPSTAIQVGDRVSFSGGLSGLHGC